MTSTRYALVVLTLLALAPRAEAQFTYQPSVPDGLFVEFLDPINNAPVGDCGIVVPAWPEELLVDCQLNGAPTTLQVWKGQPVPGGTPAAVLPYGGGTLSVQNPTANLVHEMQEGTLWLEVLDAAGSMGQGPIVRPLEQSFARFVLNGAGHVPPNPTTATGICDLLVLTNQLTDDLISFECRHNVPNAQFGQLRLGNPSGPIVRDFSNQLSNPVRNGVFRSPLDRDPFLDGEVFIVIDESVAGARIAGQATCWNGEQTNGDHALCLNDNRFRVDVRWADSSGATGSGIGSSVGDDSGLFWYFQQDNWDLLVKVLDECAATDSFWVFASGMTSVEVDITVTDTQTNQVQSCFNPLGVPFQSIQDTTAFDNSCP